MPFVDTLILSFVSNIVWCFMWLITFVPLPLLNNISQFIKLTRKAGAARDVERANLVEVLSRMAKSVAINRIKKSNRDSKPRRKLVLDLVEDVLVMLTRVPLSGRVPILEEFDCVFSRLCVEEPAIRDVC